MYMMKDYDIYVFDLDGTLLDTLDDLTNSVNAALQHVGLPTHTRDATRVQWRGGGARPVGPPETDSTGRRRGGRGGRGGG